MANEFEYIPGIPLVHPFVDEGNRGFWESLRNHVLSIQRCQNCGFRAHPPRPMCPRGLSSDMGWEATSGRGVVHTWVTFVYDRAGYPGIKCPYAVCVVELQERGTIVLMDHLYEFTQFWNVSVIVNTKPMEIGHAQGIINGRAFHIDQTDAPLGQ